MTQIRGLKKLLEQKQFIRIVGAHNGMTAKLVEKNGFEGIWASGLEISTSRAVPDANILTMTDFLKASNEIVDSTSIPVISDCDTGFGNSNNVMYMVKKFEAAGVSAVCIEDKKFPKVNSFVPGRQDLAPIAEFVGKLMAAKHTRQTDDFLIFARTEALIAGWGIDEAIRRANTYIDAGADGIFIHSKANTPSEIINFCKKWKKRSILIICPTTYPDLTEREMRELGVDIVVYANHGIRASIKALNGVLGYIHQNGLTGVDKKIADMPEIFELQGMHLMKKHETKYLGSEIGGIKAVIPAAGSKIDDSLKTVLEDRPLAMLDINGKSVIQRNIETLNKVGIQDINVVVGYKKEMVNIEGVEIIDNKDFDTKGLMNSILVGIEKPAEKNIIAYSDIIFDQELIRKLQKKEDDIILVVDGTYKKTHFRNKELELVLTESPPPDSVRTLDVNKTNRVLKIGKELDEKKAHYEFVGIACCSKKGIDVFQKEYLSSVKNKEKIGKELHPVESSSFAEFIQYLIDKGYPVSSYVVAEGWVEVHNFDDYRKVTSLFS